MDTCSTPIIMAVDSYKNISRVSWINVDSLQMNILMASRCTGGGADEVSESTCKF